MKFLSLLSATTPVAFAAATGPAAQIPLQGIEEPTINATRVIGNIRGFKCPQVNNEGGGTFHADRVRERVAQATEAAFSRLPGEMCPSNARGVGYPKRFGNYERFVSFPDCVNHILCEYPLKLTNYTGPPQTPGTARIVLSFEGPGIRPGQDVRFCGAMGHTTPTRGPNKGKDMFSHCDPY